MIDVVVVAAGRGSRFGEKKQWKLLKGRPVVAYSLEVFDNHPLVSSILLGVPEEDISIGEKVLARYAPSKGRLVFPGGGERYHTVMNGLAHVCAEYVAVHDGARPFVKGELLDRLFDAMKGGVDGVVPAVASRDTVKEVEGNLVKSTLDRSRVFLVQTPQLFRTDALKRAYELLPEGASVTDDASVVELAGGKIVVVEGDEENFKITTPEDWRVAEAMFSDVRMGFGYDIHRTCQGHCIRLGGVDVPAEFGLSGHSDADVVIHALVDALLGALGLGDIGEWFPDTDDKWRGADSSIFLKKAVEKVREMGYEIGSVDITIVAQRPKLSSYKGAIRESLSRMLGVGADRVNVKAKTKEGLDSTGRCEAVEAYAVVVVH